MPAIHRTIYLLPPYPPPPHSPRTLVPLTLRHSLSTSSRSASSAQFRRSDFSGQGYTAPYEPGAPTVGPLAQASKHGAPRLTPSLLKEHLDKYVVGQAKAKKVTSVAIYNHYQRIRELRRLEAEELERKEKDARRLLSERERNSHPVENEFPGHVETVDLNPPRTSIEDDAPEIGSNPLEENFSTIIEKSNLLLLGPSGVGKTYILQSLARVLEVPFATVDCSALTQAGYIGTDIESSIERLLQASNYSISKTETGIIFFDELDKLAKPAVMTHGRDVSGEGVQQGLLKMIEGTAVTVNAKSDKNNRTENATGRGGDRLERGGRESSSGQQPGKSEQYTIDTTNILFVFAGAFVGLEKIISSRLSSGTSIGFGAQLRNSNSNSPTATRPSTEYPLDHVLPSDLQTYGLIPELLGRIPILASLHPLTLPHLVSILTEPRNSLVNQYTALLQTSNIHLKFTTAALHAIAERALDPSTSTSGAKKQGTTSPSTSTSTSPSGSSGARGLRAAMESVLGEIMFWGPGSSIRYCLVDEKFVRGYDESASANPFQESKGSGNGKEEIAAAGGGGGDNSGVGGGGGGERGLSLMPRCWSRGQGRFFEEAWEREEEVWRERSGRESDEGEAEGEGDGKGGFERFREVGSSGM